MQHDLNGVVIVDKPAGITSAKVVSRIKHLFGVKKAGHTGTLDPLATGVMVCCVNQATRLAGLFLHDDKKYVAVLKLGEETDTLDAAGRVTDTYDGCINAGYFSDDIIKSAFKQFEGQIDQAPPVFSALKHKGVPLYKLARNGNPVQKMPRRVFISNITIIEINLPFIQFEVSCSSGTYIRSLCSDVGKVIGCGAHLNALRRVECGSFSVGHASTLTELEEAAVTGTLHGKLIPMNDALRGMPEIIAGEKLEDKILHGRKLTEKDLIDGSSGLNDADRSKRYLKIVNKQKNLISVLSFENNTLYKYLCVFHS